VRSLAGIAGGWREAVGGREGGRQHGARGRFADSASELRHGGQGGVPIRLP
jgi:hypothetical protein